MVETHKKEKKIQ